MLTNTLCLILGYKGGRIGRFTIHGVNFPIGDTARRNRLLQGVDEMFTLIVYPEQSSGKVRNNYPYHFLVLKRGSSFYRLLERVPFFCYNF